MAALASPTVSSRNCIQTDQPLLPADDGRTTIDVLVEVADGVSDVHDDHGEAEGDAEG